ncbi:cell death-inducing p53-target protein 1 homolog isoform X2 [Amphibalanus amphitrite]|uniref:cell death-inducing p53-target protein 1 homolog isoform X2 n=1 Tax=Amphibalanus amphitrite TaxID=1232801 RepID=UPI001C909941|nr:cell death-inducing p53-target protein 1 homolog isoform X2 [Amphibalanus amphitrite]
MSKPSAPSHDYQQPNQGPPSYNQAISEGASPHLPPGPANYKPPEQQPSSYGGYGPPPGAAGYPQYGQQPYGQYGPQQQQQQYGQYGPHQQQQQYGQYGPPPGGVPMAVPTATVIQTVPYTGPNPTHMMCPHCHAEIDTSVRSSPSTTAWVSGLLIALFGCWMGCCLILQCLSKCHYLFPLSDLSSMSD